MAKALSRVVRNASRGVGYEFASDRMDATLHRCLEPCLNFLGLVASYSARIGLRRVILRHRNMRYRATPTKPTVNAIPGHTSSRKENGAQWTSGWINRTSRFGDSMRMAPASPPANASASAGSRITRSPIAISGRAITSHPTRNTPVPQITQPITVPGPLTKTQNTTPAISHVVPSAFIDAPMRSLPVLGTASSLPNPRHDFAVWRTCAGHGTVGGPAIRNRT